MPEWHRAIAFAGLAFMMAVSPGPNMAYLVSRSIGQGRSAGLVSLGGVLLGFAIYGVLTACGITAMLLAVLQLLAAAMVHTAIIVCASRVARVLIKRPGWARAQRRMMGTVLALLAAKMMVQSRS